MTKRLIPGAPQTDLPLAAVPAAPHGALYLLTTFLFFNYFLNHSTVGFVSVELKSNVGPPVTPAAIEIDPGTPDRESPPSFSDVSYDLAFDLSFVCFIFL